MKYVKVEGNQVVATELPEVGVLKDGRTVSGYHLLPEDALKEEGWLPLVDNPPTYDPSSEVLKFVGYDIKETKVIAKYEVEKAEKIDQVEVARHAKLAELRTECRRSIYNGFVSSVTDKNGVPYEFRYNQLDQLNFYQVALRLAQNPPSAEYLIPWKTKNVGVVELTVEQFNRVIEEGEAHKLEKQKRFWELEAQLKAATTADAIQAIKWS